MLHIYRKRRPGQLRDVSWLAPVLLRLRDLGDYEAALLMKAKIEACLAAVVSEDGDEAMTGPASGLLRDAQGRTVESFEPGMILYRRGMGSVEVVNPSGGVTVTLPDNPETIEGYDPAVPVERDARGSTDPLMNTTTAVALFNAFRQGTAMSLMAILGATAGNRFCVIAPAAKATGLRPSDRDGLGQFDITFQLDGADSPIFLAQF